MRISVSLPLTLALISLHLTTQYSFSQEITYSDKSRYKTVYEKVSKRDSIHLPVSQIDTRSVWQACIDQDNEILPNINLDCGDEYATFRFNHVTSGTPYEHNLNFDASFSIVALTPTRSALIIFDEDFDGSYYDVYSLSKCIGSICNKYRNSDEDTDIIVSKSANNSYQTVSPISTITKSNDETFQSALIIPIQQDKHEIDSAIYNLFFGGDDLLGISDQVANTIATIEANTIADIIIQYESSEDLDLIQISTLQGEYEFKEDLAPTVARRRLSDLESMLNGILETDVERNNSKVGGGNNDDLNFNFLSVKFGKSEGPTSILTVPVSNDQFDIRKDVIRNIVSKYTDKDNTPITLTIKYCDSNLNRKPSSSADEKSLSEDLDAVGWHVSSRMVSACDRNLSKLYTGSNITYTLVYDSSAGG